MADSRVRIGSCRDMAEAALVRAVMTAHEIGVYISGEHHAAMVGMGAILIDQVIWVDAEDAEEASALLRELREGGEGSLADDEVPVDDDGERHDEVGPGGPLVTSGDDTLSRVGKKKRIVLAIIVGMSLGFGTAHLSARAWMRGVALAAIQIVGLMRLIAGDDVGGATLFFGGRLADVFGAIWEIARTGTPIAPAIATIRRR